MALAIVAVFSSCKSKNVEQESVNPIVSTNNGKVQGVLVDNGMTTVFRGIPYAAPPVGDLRWKKPQPVANWDTVRICDTFSSAAIQASHSDPEEFYTKEFYWEGDPEFSEDCLYLNVWTPTEAASHPEKKLPVAMWIHGGAYTHGWGFEVTMDGESWAKRDVILVTINYRVGALGFLCHPLLAEEGNGESGNYGTWDQAAALRWVKDNIANFGGDPNNITVFGQSAGAASVKNMVASPVTKGLLSRAIIQSGGGLGEFIPESRMQESLDFGKALMEMAGCTTLEQMRALSPQELQDLVANYRKEKKQYPRLSPVTGDQLLPKSFDQATLDGEIADVPYMIGWNLDDMGDMSKAIARFAETRAKQSKQPAYVYEFMRKLPGDDSGAFLSEQMLDAWTNFAKYGNPNGNGGNDAWKPFTPENKAIHEFDIAR